jgi:ribose-phosphate pyrophosphokinase
MIKVNGTTVEVKKFPNGESLINLENVDIKRMNEVEFKFTTDADLISLMFVKNAIDDTIGVNKTHLICGYVPYSRMDRTEGFIVPTLKYVTRFINNLNFDSVTISEPHSSVTTTLLNRVRVSESLSVMLCKHIMDKIKFTDNDIILYPDDGAAKRYKNLIEHKNIMIASKVRDFLSGNIIGMTIDYEFPTEPFRVIIVDDLCCGGRTFITASEILKSHGAGDIYLAVTHCENTIYNGKILTTDLIKEVHTTDSILTDLSSDKIHVLSV